MRFFILAFLYNNYLLHACRLVQYDVSREHSILKASFPIVSTIPIRLVDTIRHRLQLGYPLKRDRLDMLPSNVVVVWRSVVVTHCCDVIIGEFQSDIDSQAPWRTPRKVDSECFLVVWNKSQNGRKVRLLLFDRVGRHFRDLALHSIGIAATIWFGFSEHDTSTPMRSMAPLAVATLPRDTRHVPSRSKNPDGHSRRRNLMPRHDEYSILDTQSNIRQWKYVKTPKSRSEGSIVLVRLPPEAIDSQQQIARQPASYLGLEVVLRETQSLSVDQQLVGTIARKCIIEADFRTRIFENAHGVVDLPQALEIVASDHSVDTKRWLLRMLVFFVHLG